MRFVDLVEQNDAVGFQSLLEQRMSEKVGTILRECQTFIAQKMFLENEDGPHDPACGYCGDPACEHCFGKAPEGPYETSAPDAVEAPAAAV